MALKRINKELTDLGRYVQPRSTATKDDIGGALHHEGGVSPSSKTVALGLRWKISKDRY
jgi:hypothetical protein